MLLNRLAQVYDIYVMVQMASESERHQIQRLLNNAHLMLDPRKILYCSTEQGKMHLIQHIQPFMHIEGGSETNDGRQLLEQLVHVEQKIWIKSNATEKDNTDTIQCADNLLTSCIAKQVGFA